MPRLTLFALSALAVLASPAHAGEPAKPDQPDKPVTQQEPTATDVVATPAADLNLKKDEIPTLLTAAQEQPYGLRGIGTCQQIGGAILELDAVLGQDIDVPQDAGKRVSPGRVAQSIVGAFIPFRGVIREVSGANNHDRAMQAAILAGVARRSFLKGLGQAKGCRYPARAATAEVYNARMTAMNEDKAAKADQAKPARSQSKGRSDVKAMRYVSRPVVQQSD